MVVALFVVAGELFAGGLFYGIFSDFIGEGDGKLEIA